MTRKEMQWKSYFIELHIHNHTSGKKINANINKTLSCLPDTMKAATKLCQSYNTFFFIF